MVLTAERPRGRTSHRWTDEEHELIRLGYDHTRDSAERLALRLGTTYHAVKGRIALLGLARTKPVDWTTDEDEQLMALLPRMSPKDISRRMCRSVNAITVRANRLHLSRRIREGWFTKGEACEILGVDHHWLQARIDAGQLKATWHHGHRPSQTGQSQWHIEEKDLRAFVLKYRQDLHARPANIPSLIELVAGDYIPY